MFPTWPSGRVYYIFPESTYFKVADKPVESSYPLVYKHNLLELSAYSK